ncbi:Ig-like domain-containing protein [Saccharibacillus endophyticus]|uniref:SLH domain-containing protein n=1 Tax=Saccharibacillus endophyticus TaxID=2060666 RepID=A0ABQ2A6V3_9BACL|nr:Ig-like domain-containing protein [Saccharibacillus endophyticus]GGH85569.1 hypothetical protein GCM10007362_43300 [Saccharibacillus endophyticus]
MRAAKKIGAILLVGCVITGIWDSKAMQKAYAAAPMLAHSISVSDTALKIGDSATVTFVFTEAVIVFDVNDIKAPSGTISNLSSSDGGITWTATLEPKTAVQSANNVLTLDYTGIMNAGGEIGIGSVDSSNYSVDTIRPSLLGGIQMSNPVLNIGSSTIVTFIFAEAVTGFNTADLTVSNGTISNLFSNDGGTTWTATLFPSSNVSDASNVVTLHYSGISDLTGNAGIGSVDSPDYSVDTVRPSLASNIEISDTVLKAGDTAAVTFRFTEAVTGFDADDVTVPNGTLKDFLTRDNGNTWTATLTPALSVNDAFNSLTIHYAGITDLAGNSGSGTVASVNYSVDTLIPTAGIVITPALMKIGDTADVTFAFSEAVSGFTTADLTVSNGTVRDLSSTDGGITWTGSFVPIANVEASDNIITLDNTGVVSLSGNTGFGKTDSNTYTIDTRRPTAEIFVSDTILRAGTTAEVKIEFSEPVTGFALGSLEAANGALSDLASSDGGKTWTATLTPSDDTSSTTNAILLDYAAVTDLAGNVGTGTMVSDNYEVRTVRPTAVVTVDNSMLTPNTNSTVKIVFSEAVTGLTTEDLTIENGTLSALGSADGGITWTATLTPKPNASAAANYITLRNDGITNASGNAGIGTTRSNAYAVMTMPPPGSGGSPAPAVPSAPIEAPSVFVPSETPNVSVNGVLTLPAGKAGSVSLGDAVRIDIPAGASRKELKLTIERVANANRLTTNGEILASPVFELLKSSSENFVRPVKLSIAFDPKTLTDGRRAALSYYDETVKKWIEVSGANIQGNRISAEVDHFTKYAVFAAEQPTETADDDRSPQSVIRDTAGHWAEDVIRQAVSAGVVSGYPDGTFKPDADVTRAEFAVMLMRALNATTSGASLVFTDSSEIGSWAQTAVAQAVQSGILNGYADGSFRPNAVITRAEMAVMAARAMKLPAAEVTSDPAFADDQAIPSWAKGAAAALKNAEVIQGTGANAFKPDARTTRAEAAKVLMNLLDAIGKN